MIGRFLRWLHQDCDRALAETEARAAKHMKHAREVEIELRRLQEAQGAVPIAPAAKPKRKAKR